MTLRSCQSALSLGQKSPPRLYRTLPAGPEAPLIPQCPSPAFFPEDPAAKSPGPPSEKKGFASPATHPFLCVSDTKQLFCVSAVPLC